MERSDSIQHKLLQVVILLTFMLSPGFTAPITRASAQADNSSFVEHTPDWEVRLWLDEAGDIWVETPLYHWNITAGSRIVSQADQALAWLSPGGRQGGRLLDSLFLLPGSEPLVNAEIVFNLPDSGMVYLEKAGQQGREGLALTFRAADGLITLARDWQVTGEELDTPVGSRQLEHYRLAAGRNSNTYRLGELPSLPEGLKPTVFQYQLQYDEQSQLGFALLQSMDAVPLEPVCTSLPAGDSSWNPLCSQPHKIFLGRQYVLLFGGRGFTGQSVNSQVNYEQLLLTNISNELQLALPDLNAASISRTPRYDYDSPKNNPAPGDTVQFTARLANRGGLPSGPFNYTWSIDGLPVNISTAPSLQPGGSLEVSLSWTWQSGPHTVAIALDPANQVREISELNNRVNDRTDGLALGLWVEQSVYDWFNQHQVELGLGSVSWDDWAQRQVRAWNQMLAMAVSPLTPQGVFDRVRLDKVMIVPDGTLPGPYPTNFPARMDQSVDLQWGFPSELVGVPRAHPNLGPVYLVFPEALNVEFSLLHELSHARYLDDLYGINVVADPAQLAQAVDANAAVLTMTTSVESQASFTTPAYLAVGGELVICQGRSGPSFTGCQRGADGTRPRPHASGTRVTRAIVRLQDGQGSLVMGSPAMALLGWDDHLYFNRYPGDVMSGGRIYDQHSAYALNRIAGQRPRCGNYNPPCNLGEYQNDVPARNILLLRRGGQPALGAQVEVYRAKPFAPVWYGKIFSGPPDAVYTAGADGRVDLGPFPFSSTEKRVNAYNRVLLLKITSQGSATYHWFDITQVNEAYWYGQTAAAEYLLDLLTTPQVDTWIITSPLTAGRPKETVQVRITYGNSGLEAASTVSLSAVYSSGLLPAAYSHTPDADTGERLTWALPDLRALQAGELAVTFALPDAAFGTKYHVQWEISSGAPDMFPSNNLAASQIEISHIISLPVLRR